MVTAVLAANKRLGASPAKNTGARVWWTIPKHINRPSRRLWSYGLGHNAEVAPRGTATGANKPMPPASNAWGSFSLLHSNSDGGSDSVSHISDCPSGGSCTTSTIGNDFLDLPSNNLPTAKNHLRSTKMRSGSSELSPLPDSFTRVLKVPLRTNSKCGPTTHGKGFVLSMDDFPVLGSENSESNTQRGQNLEGTPTVGSGSQMVQDEQRKILLTGDAQVPATILPWGTMQAQQHGTNVPQESMTPPWFNYWHPPPDRPPDGNEMLRKGAIPYSSDKPSDTHNVCAVELFAYHGQSQLNQEAARLSEGIQKQTVIKKDVALLEKIKCLNIKARKLRACSMNEHSKSIYAKVDHVILSSAVTSDTTSSVSDPMSTFDRANSVSEKSNFVLSDPVNVLDSSITIASLSEVHGTEFSKAGNPGKSGDHDAYGRRNTSRNRHDGSAKHISSYISGNGWEVQSAVDSLQDVMTYAQQEKSFPRNASQQVHVKAADEMLSWIDNEVQHSRTGELSAQHAKQSMEYHKHEQKAKTIAGLDELKRHSSVQRRKTNYAPQEADNLHFIPKNGSNGATTYAPLPANRINHITAFTSSTPASNIASIIEDPLIYNVLPSAKNTDTKMIEHTARKSTSQSYDTSVQKHWQMENMQTQVESWERITMERSNISERAESVKNIAETPADAWSAEGQCHEDFLMPDKNSRRDAAAARLASPPVFDNEKNATKVSSVHETHAGVVISNSMIPAHITSVSGITVGSIVLGDISLISVNHEMTTAAKERHGTSSYSRPHETKGSRNNQPGQSSPLNDGAMCTPVQQPSKKKQPEKHFEFKTYDACENLLETAHTAPMPIDTWQSHRSSDSRSQYHVEAQRNSTSNNAGNIYKGMRGKTHASYKVQNLSRAHWMPKSFSRPQSNSQGSDISEWMHDCYESISNMDNSEGFDGTAVDSSCSKPIQNVEGDSEIDLDRWHLKGDVKFEDGRLLVWNPRDWEYQAPSPRHHGQYGGSEIDLYSGQIGDVKCEDGHRSIWNPTDWEYQPLDPAPLNHGQNSGSEKDLYSGQIKADMNCEDGNPLTWNPRDLEYQSLNPAPHHNGQHSEKYHGGDDTYSERGYDARKPTCGKNGARRKASIHSEYKPKPVGSSDLAPDIQWNPGAR